MYSITCKSCNKISYSPWKGTRYCNRECYRNDPSLKNRGMILGKSRKGTHPKRFPTKKRPGFHINHDGYKMILIKNHPIKKRYIMEHRLVMEKHIGRILRPEEVVHHKNHNRTDNRLENLELIESQKTHIINNHNKRDDLGRFKK